MLWQPEGQDIRSRDGRYVIRPSLGAYALWRDAHQLAGDIDAAAAMLLADDDKRGTRAEVVAAACVGRG